MAVILDKIAKFLGSKEFDILGMADYSPAIYIAAAGAVLILIGFFIALIALSSGRTKKCRVAVEDAATYANKVGNIDEKNVSGLNAKIKGLPASIRSGWGNFLDQQTGYPSDYITEKNVVDDGRSKIESKAALSFFNAFSWIVIVLFMGITAVAYKDYFTSGVENIMYASLTVIGALVAPIIVYIIFLAILKSAAKGQYKKFRAAFRKFQDALDNNVLIFREEQDEFVSENIEEINANIEEILANRLNSTEIIDIVTVPSVEEDDEVKSYKPEELIIPTEEEIPAEEIVAPVEAVELPAPEVAVEIAEAPAPAPKKVAAPKAAAPKKAPAPKKAAPAPVVEVKEEVAAAEPEAIVEEEPEQTEEERRGTRLLQLVYIADAASKDPNITKEDIDELTKLIYDAKVGGDYPGEDEQEIFDACLTILAHIGE